MNIIIAGSRDVVNKKYLEDITNAVVELGDLKPTIISGTCRGGDQLGELWAKNQGVECIRMPAKWTVNGVFIKAAGYKRNVEMINVADAVIALWDGLSLGTSHTLKLAHNKRIPVIIIYTGDIK